MDPNKWCIALNPTRACTTRRQSRARCGEPEPDTDTDLRRHWLSQHDVASKNVKVSIKNNTGVNQVLTCVNITWPQATNGNLNKIKFDGTRSITRQPAVARLAPVRCWARRPSGRSPRAKPTAYSLASRTTSTPNANHYTGSLTFNPFGPLTILP